MSVQKKNCIVLIVTMMLVALVAGLFVSHYFPFKKSLDKTQFHGTLLEKPRGVNPFSLTGIDNKSFTNTSLTGQWTMIFFGFTQCGYLCPTTMTTLNKMYSRLEEAHVKRLPNVVMISIDSKRDNLSKLKHYVKAFNPHFYGAIGQEKMIKKMTREMGIAYTKIVLSDPIDSESYDIQHSGAIILFNPQGELTAFFTTPHNAELLAEDYRLLVA